MGKDYILVIEDDAHMRDFIVAVLNSHHVIAVETGEEGLQHIETSPPKLVLLDLILPGMSGNEVAQKLAAGQIPFIIASASTDWELILQAISHGARSFVAKPFMPIELQAAVIAALQQSSHTSPFQERDATHDNHDVTLACGILSARFNISEQEACSILRKNAQTKNKTMPELALEIIEANNNFNTIMSNKLKV